MQALLSLSSHVQSVEAPSNPSRLQNPNIAMTTLGHFTTSLVDVLAETRQLGEQRDHRAQVCDLRFLRRLMTLWTAEWDSLSELDQLIENLQVCSSTELRYGYIFTSEPVQSSSVSKNQPNDDSALIQQHLLRTQVLLAPLLPPIVPASQPPLHLHPNKTSSTKDTRTESLLQFGVPAVEQMAQPVMDLAKPGPRFGSLLKGSTIPR
jgi:hypothetical protein